MIRRWACTGAVTRVGFNSRQDFTVFDILTGHNYIWNQEWNYIALNPWEMPVHLFKIEL